MSNKYTYNPDKSQIDFAGPGWNEIEKKWSGDMSADPDQYGPPISFSLNGDFIDNPVERISVEETAGKLGCQPYHIRQLCIEGDLNCRYTKYHSHRGGYRWMINTDEDLD